MEKIQRRFSEKYLQIKIYRMREKRSYKKRDRKRRIERKNDRDREWYTNNNNYKHIGSWLKLNEKK